MITLTTRQATALRHAAWATEHFDGVTTSRETRARVIRRLEALGLVKYVGDGPMCDGDGWTIQPERIRAIFAITEAGKTWLEDAEHRSQAEAAS